MLEHNYLHTMSKDGNEGTNLFLVLNQHFGSYFNKVRVKLMSMFAMSMVKPQTTNFNSLSNSFGLSLKMILC